MCCTTDGSYRKLLADEQRIEVPRDGIRVEDQASVVLQSKCMCIRERRIESTLVVLDHLYSMLSCLINDILLFS